MPNIDIRRAHNKSLQDARTAIEHVASHLGERFGIDYGWNGDVMEFARSGVHGAIALSPKQVRVTAHLGFLLMALKGPIEQEVRRYLDEEFG